MTRPVVPSTPHSPPADPAMARLREHVVAAAAATDWAGLVVEARAFRDAWQTAAAGLTAADGRPAPQNGPWTAWHLCNHVSAWLDNAVRALTNARWGRSTDLGPEQAWHSGAPSMAVAAAAARANAERWLEAVTRAADERVAVQHRLLGELSLRQFAVLTHWHLRDHARQLQTLRAEHPARTGPAR